MSGRVLVYEPDDVASRAAIVGALDAAGWAVVAPAGPSELRAALGDGVDVALLDVGARRCGVGGAVGLARRTDPDAEVIGLSRAGDVSGAVRALKAGAHTVCERPAEAAAVEAVLRAFGRARRPRDVQAPGHEADRFLGASSAIAGLRAEIEATARAAHGAVLLHGEAGTGKTLAAEIIHRLSARRRGPLERVSVLGVTDREADARLFGRVGAAASDLTEIDGALARAHRGALVLEHVESLGPDVQAKLTAFLDTGAFRPAGRGHGVSADVRVFATTRADLVRRVASGRFSAELYYRLTVHPLSLPPLRARPEDVRPLVSAFLDRANRRYGKRVVGVQTEALERLAAHPWPGNVRELEHAILEAVAGAAGETLSLQDLPALGHAVAVTEDFRLPDEGVDLDEVERRLVVEALVRTQGNRSQAARLLGLNRDQMRYRVEKYRLQYRRF